MKNFLMVTILTVILSTTNLYAETYVSGTIVNETWNSSGSPYYVEGDILVAGLTIEPGVRVEFLDNYVFEVAGVLTAIGIEEDQILFTAAETNENGWQGIFFNYSSPGSEIAYCTIEESINSGIRIDNSNPTIRNCKIINNLNSGSDNIYGGGIYSNSSLVLSNCYIANNSVSASGGTHPHTKGGGIYVDGSLTLENCTIENNTAKAGVYNSLTTAYAFGGGIFINGQLSVRNSSIKGNLAEGRGTGGGTGHGRGGGLYAAGEATISNCILYNNSSVGITYNVVESNSRGGGFYLESGTATLNNCTVSDNKYHGVYNGGGVLSAMNSIFWENTLSQIFGNATVTYSDVQDGYEGDGNINSNPIFNDCLKILPGSLCIDAGNPDPQYNDVCLPPSLGGVRNDMGAHGGPGACQWCVPKFSANLTKGDAPLLVNFTNQSTGTLDSWNWSFGDGSTSNEKDPSHIYTHPGLYNIALTVTCSCTEGSYIETKTGFITVLPNRSMPWIPLLLLDD